MGNFNAREYVKKKYNNSNKNEKKDTQPSQKKQSTSFDARKYVTQKHLNQTIGFDTFESDFKSLVTTLDTVHSGWQTKETMDNTRNSLQSMYDRLGKYQEYQKQYGGADLTDVYNALGEELAGWDDFSWHYEEHKNADAYNKAMKDAKAYAEERERMKTDDLNAVQKEIDDLESMVNNAKSQIWLPEGGTYQQQMNARKRDQGYNTLTNEHKKDDEVRDTYAQSLGYKNLDDLEKALGEKKKYYNQAEWIQKGIEMASVNDPEFAEKSKYVPSKYTNKVLVTSFNKAGDVYQFINADKEEQDNIVGNYADTQATVHLATSGYEYMTDQEIALYNYYFNEFGGEKALEYLNTILQDVGLRKATADFDRYKDSPVKEYLFGVNAGLDQFGTGLKNLFNTKDEYIPVNATQQLSGMIRQDLKRQGSDYTIIGDLDLGDVSAFGYDAITTTSNMLPSILTSTVVGVINPTAGAVVGAGLMGASASGNAYQEMLNLGYGKGSARAYSAMVGVSEAALQYALGGIGKLGGISGKLATAIKGIDKGFAKFAIRFGGSMLSEGFEEGLQEVLNPLFMDLAAGYDTGEEINWEEVAYSALLGGLTGGLFGGAESLSSFSETKYNRGIGANIKANERVGEIFDMASISPEASSAYDTYTMLTNKGISAENVSDYQLGLLAADMRADADAITKSKKYTDEQKEQAKKVLEDLDVYAQANVGSRTGSAKNLKLKTLRDFENLDEIGVKAFLRDTLKSADKDTEIYNITKEYVAKLENGEKVSAKELKGLYDRTVAESFIKEGLERGEGTEAHKLATEYKAQIESGKKLSDDQLLKLYGATNTEKKSEEKSDVTNKLIEKGVDSDIADIVARKLRGEMLTEEEYQKIDKSTAAKVLLLEETDPDIAEQVKSFDNETADLFFGMYDGKAYMPHYANDFALISEYASHPSFTKEEMLKRIGHSIPKEKAIEIFEKQRIASDKASAKKMKEAMSKIREGQSKEGFVDDTVFDYNNTSAEGKVNWNRLTKKQQKAVTYATGLFKGIGAKLVWVDSRSNGAHVLDNGWYGIEDDTIFVDVFAGANVFSGLNDDIIINTLSHELTHKMEIDSPELFAKVRDIVLDALEKSTGKSRAEIIADELARLKEEHPDENHTEQDAISEIVARACEDMLSVSKEGKRIFNSLSENDQKTITKMIKDIIKDIIDWIDDLLSKYTSKSDEAISLKANKEAFEEVSKLWDKMLAEIAEQNKSSKQKVNAKNESTTDGKMLKQARELQRKDPTKLTEDDFKNLLKFAEEKILVDDTYIPARINTPQILIEFAKVQGYVLDNHPLAMRVYKVRQALSNESEWDGDYQDKPHDLSIDEVVDIVKGMDNPSYLVYQTQNDRFAEIVKFEKDGEKEKAYAIIDFFDVDKNPEYLNGYEGGKYNILVTIYPSENSSELKKYLDNKNNIVMTGEEMKKKATSQRGSGSFVPSHLNDIAFFNDSIPNPDENVKTNFSNEDSEQTKALEDVGVQVDTESGSVAPKILRSERTWTKSEYVQSRETAINAIVKALDVSRADAERYVNNINGIAKMIADDRTRLDYDPNVDDNASVLKHNKEYKWTVDMSTLCAKRLLYTGTFDAIQKRLPNTVFNSEDMVELRSMMMNRGLEVACGICYVESTRRELGSITAEFIERYKLSQQTGKPITKINSEGKEKVIQEAGTQRQFVADKNYTPTLAELNTTDIDRVKVEHPDVYAAYLSFMKSRGQATPKLLETRTEYKGEILKHFKSESAVKSRNDSGGLRVQSFSDFEVAHLIDMMQIVLDMSRVGLMSQAYTKVPAFADVFGNTGMKINLSLIAKGSGLDANGNLIFDDVEGMPSKEAFRLRNKYSKNVGTILVGKNDAHIRAALADPKIDFVIPYHKSFWKESLYEALGLTGYEDYTDTQNEKAIDPERKIKNFQPSEYWDYSKSGEENAQTYLKMCKEDGRIPKFPQFAHLDGYWKLLIDFKMYDNEGVGSPQMVVKPEFAMDEATEILNSYKGGHRSFPVAKDVVEDFVKQFEGRTDILYSRRDSEGRTLTEAQQEFFKDSKVRDKDENLLVVYHGTPNKFTIFRQGVATGWGKGIYFTDNRLATEEFGENVVEAYLNITNPFNADTMSYDKIGAEKTKTYEEFDRKFWKNWWSEQYDTYDEYKSDGMGVDMYDIYTEYVDVFNQILRELGYDGIISYKSNNIDGYEIVAFHENQVKLTSNTNPTKNRDIRYSRRKTDERLTEGYKKIREMQIEIGELYDKMAEIEDSDGYKERFNRIVESTTDSDSEKAISDFNEWIEESGYLMFKERRDSLEKEVEQLSKDLSDYSTNKAIDEEKKAIEKSGLSEADYFRKLAVKEFGYTPYFIDAGYITPNGKMLNFSGEKGMHYGMRGQDHRAIETIYAGVSRTDAMLKFMSEGNIRIMAESPGIDISSSVEPSKEQYSTIRKFVREFSNNGYFNVDITDASGRTVGNYEYEGRVSAERVANDIKYFFEHGTTREQSSISQFLYQRRDTSSVYDTMGETERLKKENEMLDRDVGRFKEIIGTEAVDNKKFLALANYLKKLTGSSVDTATLGNMLKKKYSAMQSDKSLTWEDVSLYTYDIAESVMNRDLSVSVDYFKNVMHEIRKEKISLSEEQRERMEKRFGNYGNFHKYVFGNINITKDGKPLTDVWQAWAKLYPSLFDPDVSSDEQIDALLDAVDILKSTNSMMGEYERAEAIRYLSTEIYNKFWNIATDSSSSNNATSYKTEHKTVMKELRQGHEDRLKDLATHPAGETVLKYENLLRKAKESKKRELSRAKERGKEMLDSYKDNAERKTYIQRITSNALSLNELLEKNSKDKHVPEVMKPVVEELLSAIDFSSKRKLEGGMPTKKDISIERALGHLRNVVAKGSQEVGDLLDLMYGSGIDEKIIELADTVEERMNGIRDNEEFTVVGVKKFTINDMTTEELKELNDIVKIIKHTVNEVNKFHTVHQNKYVQSVGMQSMEDIDSRAKIYEDGGKHFDKLKTHLYWNNLNPYYAFKNLGEAPQLIFNALQDGQDKLAFLSKEVIDSTESVYDAKHYKKWSDTFFDFEFLQPNGKTVKFKMNVPQIMSLYCVTKQEDGLRHILHGDENGQGGGITIVETKKTDAVRNNIQLTKEQLDSILAKLEDKDAVGNAKEVADALQEFMGTRGAELGNEITMARWGIRCFGIENYFPIKVSDGSVPKKNETPGVDSTSMLALLNMSFTHSRNKFASQSVEIGDMFDVFSNHMSDMIRYNAMALPILDMYKWLNFRGKTETNNEFSIQTSIKNTFGDHSWGYFNTLLRDISGGTQKNTRDKLAVRFFKNAKIAKVAGNIRVALLQPTSFIRAGAVMDNKYLLKAFAHKPKISHAEKRSGIALWKSMGYYDTDITRGLTEKIKHTESVKDKIIGWSLKPVELADKLTWGYLWNACELEIRDTRKDLEVGKPEFFKAVAERLREVIYSTQVVDSLLTRSQMMRSPDGWDKILTTFASESTLSLNLTMDTFVQTKLDARRMGKKAAFKKNAKYMRKAITAFIVTSAVSSAIQTAFDAFRDYDEEDKDMAYLSRLFFENLALNLSWLNKIPYLNNIGSILMGFTPSRVETDWMGNTVKAVKEMSKLINGEGDFEKLARYFLKAGSDVSGIAAYNVYRDIMSLYEFFAED